MTREEQARELAKENFDWLLAKGESNKERAQRILDCWAKPPVTEAQVGILEAVLAACALEEAKWWREHALSLSIHGPTHDCEYCRRIAALERAATGRQDLAATTRGEK